MAKRIKPKRTQTNLGPTVPRVPKPAYIYGKSMNDGLVKASRKQMKENLKLAKQNRKAQVQIARAPYQAKIESARAVAGILGARIGGDTLTGTANNAANALKNWRDLLGSNNAGDDSDGEKDTRSTTDNLKGR